jgi:hypothetical protein
MAADYERLRELIDAHGESGEGDGSERQIVCVLSPDAGCKAGDTFPVPEDAEF